ncbi:hypothetical protein Acr_10g0007180 [Actinidia rufa]|uniref:Retrotransposon gag domain-containing protein n=1 Tax=Actinidia rufa TaxID=165716 RepID=A0A7J0F9Q0_9ERIC|nr:hypothetical protein Acr_10g0007180 [Actinidia rufa]
MSLKVTGVLAEHEIGEEESHLAEMTSCPDVDKSITQKIRDLDAHIDAINTSASVPVTVDALIRQIEPPFIERIMRTRLFVANFMSCLVRQNNASHLFTIHQKKTKSLKEYVKQFNQAVLEVEDPSDKVVIMATMEGLRPGPLFDPLSKNVPKTLSSLQSKVDKDDVKNKRSDRDSIRTSDKCPRTLPRRPELVKEKIADLIKKGYLMKYVTDRPQPNSPEGGIETTDPRQASSFSFSPGWVWEEYDTPAMVGQVASYLGNKTPSDYCLVGFHCGGCPSPYNAILGHPTLGGTKAIIFTYHLKMKFPTSIEIGEIDDAEMEALRDEVEQITLVDPREIEKTKPLEEVTPISIHPDFLDCHVMIGTELIEELRTALVEF